MLKSSVIMLSNGVGMKNIYVIVFALISFIASTSGFAQSAVAMPDSYSATEAKKVLQNGGNAIDAAIAAQFVLAVTLPEAGNIGGGGFMTIYKDGTSDFLDYRETAPAAAHKDMYLDEQKNVIPNLSLYGILSSGVPGTVEGMWQAHKKYGTKSWEELLAPAVKLAEEGFIVHPTLRKAIEWRIDSFEKEAINVNFSRYFSQAKTGQIFKQPELAATLKLIAKHGRDGFYKGKTAKTISTFMKEHGGIITEEDLDAYRIKWRKPLQKKWRDYEVVTAPPPSSGGIAVLQWLTMFDVVKQKIVQKDQALAHNSTQYVHLLSEVGKRVFADRAEYLGDPDFYNVPQSKLLTQAYLVERASDITLDKISNTESIKPGLKESTDTTHFSIIDKWGNATSNTTTINYTFGSGVIVEGAGFILNDEMDDFSVKPGVANVFGALGGVANEVQPHKRMLSSMSPTILLKAGKVELVTGSPGGTTIISSVYQSILNAVEFNMTAEKSANSARFHHQLWPENQIVHYAGVDKKVIGELQTMGYNTKQESFGDVQIILQRDGKLTAASESRARHRGVSLVF